MVEPSPAASNHIALPNTAHSLPRVVRKVLHGSEPIAPLKEPELQEVKNIEHLHTLHNQTRI
jgi:hypothetical protein